MGRRPATLILVLPLVVGALGENAAAKQVLVVLDPKDTSKATQLLEQAVAEELRKIPANDALTLDDVVDNQGGLDKELAQIRALRESARAQFDQLDLDAALKQYVKLLARIDKTLTAPTDSRPLADTLAMIAASHLLLGADKKARATLERLLTVAPDYAPEDAVFNPQMMGVFASLAAKLGDSTFGEINVTVQPPGAAVFLDGRLVGSTPLTIKEVRKGRHIVTATARGHGRQSKNVDVKPRATPDVALTLTALPKRTPDLGELAGRALASLGGGGEADVKALLAATHTDQALFVVASGRGATATLVSGDGQRLVKSTSGEPADLDTARRMARDLAGFVQHTTPATPSIASTSVPDDDNDTLSPRPEPKARKNAAAEDARRKDSARAKDDAKQVATSDTPKADRPGVLSASATKDTLLLGLYGGAIAAALAGGVFGVLAIRDQSTYNRRTELPGGRIDQLQTTDQVEGAPIAKSGKKKALVADILYGVAGVSGAVGVALHFLWHPAGASTSVDTPASETKGKKGSSWGLAIGPGYGAVTLAF
ncbi:MAG: PEGA domain-containing protein [Deltaproteobacteria bacterium]|nr:PEGA domain-containing protein [Deltaproteobacteria bacterium]